MKHVSILVPSGAATVSCIDGSFVLFTKANDFLASRGRPRLFTVQLVGLTTEAQVYDRLFSVRPDVSIDQVRKTDLIIIPAVNVPNLMLDEEVIEAVRAGQFHIWAVRTIDEGIELLTDCPAGQRGPDGQYPEGTVHRLVEDRVREYAERLRAFTADHRTEADGDHGATDPSSGRGRDSLEKDSPV